MHVTDISIQLNKKYVLNVLLKCVDVAFIFQTLKISNSDNMSDLLIEQGER